MQRGSPVNSELVRLQRALEKVANLVAVNSVYAPIFIRLEDEIARCRVTTDAITRARAIAQSYSQPQQQPQSDARYPDQP